MPFAILLLDSNYLSSVKHAPKKWNVNYITVSGLSKEEQIEWDLEYGTDWSSVDSELCKELVVVTRMLNKLEQFGYHLISSLVSTPRIAHKDNENNRECYVWTLQKPIKTINSALDESQQQSLCQSPVSTNDWELQRQRQPKPEPNICIGSTNANGVKMKVDLTGHEETSDI